MNPTKKFFSRIGSNYLIFGICTIVLQFIILNILAITNPTMAGNINIITIISSLCNYILPFPIFYWLMKKLESQKIEKHNAGVKTFITYIGITLTLMWIGNLIGLAITNLLSGAIQNDISNPVQNLIYSTDLWLNLLLISIIAPVCEEIIFRKFIIDRTVKKSRTGFFSKSEAMLLTMLANVHLIKGDTVEAQKLLRESVGITRRFDQTPDYSLGSVRFALDTGETSLHDIMGKTAADSARTLLGLLENKKLTEMWEEIYANE